ncbi:hypothetical protein [Ferriphaselus sp. R-1]|uniref:hypothetical protein n=1 Tax=Ferriphaselus sp. R-1 TaxID=1485544 RepID=UPI001929BCBB|nr:hypothetical protein [Ferriphaselus sp. R-1]
MPRRARIALPNVPVHLIQRGNNRQPCFFADEDYRRYLDWLAEYQPQSTSGQTSTKLAQPVLSQLHCSRNVAAVFVDIG